MTTPLLLLPEIAEDQASKYLTHNEALRIMEALRWGAVVLSATATAPTGAETEGQSYILPASPTGAWASYQANDVVVLVGGAWKRHTPHAGVRHNMWVADTNQWAAWDGAAWSASGLTPRTAYRMGIRTVAGVATYTYVDQLEFRSTAGVAVTHTGPFASSIFGVGSEAANAFVPAGVWASQQPASFPEFIGTFVPDGYTAVELALTFSAIDTAALPQNFDIERSTTTTNGTDGAWVNVKTFNLHTAVIGQELLSLL